MQNWFDTGLLLVFLVSLLLVMWRILASSRVLDCSKHPGNNTSVRDWTVSPRPPTGQGAHLNLIQADSRRTVCLQISGTTL